MKEALKKVAESLEELSAAIKELCEAEKPEVKPEEVRKVLAEMSKRGKTAEVKALLARQLIDCIYYDSEVKTPHRTKSKSSEDLPF